MEAVPVEEPPKRDGRLFEPKYGGFRCILFRDDDSIHLQLRRQHPLERYFPAVIETAWGLSINRFVFDGELIIPDQPFDTCDHRPLVYSDW
jgi:ATP-dependent DNA ligase